MVLYDGSSRPHPKDRKKYKLTTIQRKEKALAKRMKDGDLIADVENLYVSHTDNLATVAKKHNRSTHYVGSLLGAKAAEGKKVRAPNVRNAWTRKKLAELNASEFLPDVLWR